MEEHLDVKEDVAVIHTPATPATPATNVESETEAPKTQADVDAENLAKLRKVQAEEAAFHQANIAKQLARGAAKSDKNRKTVPLIYVPGPGVPSNQAATFPAVGLSFKPGVVNQVNYEDAKFLANDHFLRIFLASNDSPPKPIPFPADFWN